MKKTISAALLLIASICAIAQEPDTPQEPGADWMETVDQFLRAEPVPKQAFERTWAALPIESIRLARSGPKEEIDGFYPEYEIVLSCATEESAASLGSFEYGPIEYQGKSNVERIGEFHSALTLSDFARLAILAEKWSVYEGMKDYPETMVKENPHTLLEVVMKNGEKHTLSEWGWQAPVEA